MTTARQIVTRAFNELMFYAEGDTITDIAMRDGIDQLNGLISSFHTMGLTVYYPPNSTWQGEWVSGRAYSVGNGVVVSGGNTYSCKVDHTGTGDDQPGKSINWGTYWTLYAETEMGPDSTFFFPAHHVRGIVAMLAVEMGPAFNVNPSPLTIMKAKQGEQALYGQYFNIPEAQFDRALSRMPSQVLPGITSFDT
jgi:hypothetical protein